MYFVQGRLPHIPILFLKHKHKKMDDFMITLSMNQYGTKEEIYNINTELENVKNKMFRKLIILGYIWPDVSLNLGIVISNSTHVEIITPSLSFYLMAYLINTCSLNIQTLIIDSGICKGIADEQAHEVVVSDALKRLTGIKYLGLNIKKDYTNTVFTPLFWKDVFDIKFTSIRVLTLQIEGKWKWVRSLEESNIIKRNAKTLVSLSLVYSGTSNVLNSVMLRVVDQINFCRGLTQLKLSLPIKPTLMTRVHQNLCVNNGSLEIINTPIGYFTRKQLIQIIKRNKNLKSINYMTRCIQEERYLQNINCVLSDGGFNMTMFLLWMHHYRKTKARPCSQLAFRVVSKNVGRLLSFLGYFIF